MSDLTRRRLLTAAGLGALVAGLGPRPLRAAAPEVRNETNGRR